MKKFKLVRMAALGVAATVTVSLSACSLNNKSVNNDSISDASISETFDFDSVSQYIDYKYNFILAEDSEFKCNVSKTCDNVGALIGSCYSLPEGYCLYTADLDKQFLAIPSITLEDGTQVFALTDEEALNCVGVTPEAFNMLGIIDEYERQLDTTEKMSR